eukprot:194953-Pyramimonas_sp.AAC.2
MDISSPPDLLPTPGMASAGENPPVDRQGDLGSSVMVAASVPVAYELGLLVPAAGLERSPGRGAPGQPAAGVAAGPVRPRSFFRVGAHVCAGDSPVCKST